MKHTSENFVRNEKINPANAMERIRYIIYNKKEFKVQYIIQADVAILPSGKAPPDEGYDQSQIGVFFND